MAPTIRNLSAVIAVAATALVASGCSSEDVRAADPQPSETSTSSSVESVQSGGSEAPTPGEGSRSPASSQTDKTQATSPASTASGNASQELPTDAASYADAFVRAFGEASDIAVQRMGTDSAILTLEDHGDSAASHWDRSGTSGAAGSVEVDYTNTETDEHMMILVNNERASNGDEHAVTDVKFEK